MTPWRSLSRSKSDAGAAACQPPLRLRAAAYGGDAERVLSARTCRWRFFPKAAPDLDYAPVSSHSPTDAGFRGRGAAFPGASGHCRGVWRGKYSVSFGRWVAENQLTTNDRKRFAKLSIPTEGTKTAPRSRTKVSQPTSRRHRQADLNEIARLFETSHRGVRNAG